MKENTDKNLLKGIAFNTALKENVFTMLVCLMNKIPVIVCGKPGCSKTLAFQLLLNNLRGSDSKDAFFKTLPTLLPVTYQGSLQSTSNGILRVFEKAQRFLDDNEQAKKSGNKNVRDIISVVFFDEMGLAELSRNNPLKVLHSLLEYEIVDEEMLKKRVAFVGISNWRLDVSKMSRAVFVARPELGVQDLKFTSKAVINSFESNLNSLSRYLEAMAEAYAKYRALQKSENQGIYENFHGLRDFYSLIKEACKFYEDEKKKKDYGSDWHHDLIVRMINYSIERNFGGIDGKVDKFKQLLMKELKNFNLVLDPIPVFSLIQQNFEDPESRYLMLITKSNFDAQVLLNHFSMFTNKKFNIMIGSQFEKDVDQEEYSCRTLSTIINCLEDGTSLILQGLDYIYPSLYDLFNQNFTIISQKKTCKIALGTTNNSTCTVHEDFRCIILLEEQYLSQQDPPFLNRFEKQIIGWDSILTDSKMKKTLKEVKAWINGFCTSRVLDKDFALAPYYLIINLNDENLSALVVEHWNLDANEGHNEGKILERIKWDILLTASADIVPAASQSRNSISKAELLDFYYQQPHQSLEHSLCENKKSEKKVLKSVVYTYSTMFEPLNVEGIGFAELQFGSIGSEKDLERHLKEFFNGAKDILIFRMKGEEDHKHFNFLKSLSEKFASHFEGSLLRQKHIITLFHLSRRAVVRNKRQTSSITFMKGWQQIMIDNLTNKKYIDFRSIIDLSSEEVFKTEKLIKSDEVLPGMISNSYLRLNFSNRRNEIVMSDYQLQVINALICNKHTKALLLDKVYSMIPLKKNWLLEIATDWQLLICSNDVFDAIYKFFADFIEYPVLQIIYTLESSGGMCSLLTLLESEIQEDVLDNQTLLDIWHDSFQKLNCRRQLIQQNKQNIFKKAWNTRFPFSFEDLSECFNKLNLQEFLTTYKRICIDLFDNSDEYLVLEADKKELLLRTEKEIEGFWTVKYYKESKASGHDQKCSLIEQDIYTIFTVDYLNHEDKFILLIKTVSDDLLNKDSCISEKILVLLSFQKVFLSLVYLANTLWKDSPSKHETSCIINIYNSLKGQGTEFASPFDRMLTAMLKNFYSLDVTIDAFESWSQKSKHYDEVLVYVNRICLELDIETNLLNEFILWKDLIDIYVRAGTLQGKFYQDIKELMRIREEAQGSTNETSYFYKDEFFEVYCKIYLAPSSEIFQEEGLIETDDQHQNDEKGKRKDPNSKSAARSFMNYLLKCYLNTDEQPLQLKVLELVLDKCSLSFSALNLLKVVIFELDIQLEDSNSPFVIDSEELQLIDLQLAKRKSNNPLASHIDHILTDSIINKRLDNLEEPVNDYYLLRVWRKLITIKSTSLEKLICLCILRHVIHQYCKFLFETNNEQNMMKIQLKSNLITHEIRNLLEDILNNKNEPISASFRIYAIKTLKNMYGSLKRAFSYNANVQWLCELALEDHINELEYTGFKPNVIVNHFIGQLLSASSDDEVMKMIELIKGQNGDKAANFGFLKDLCITMYWNHLHKNFNAKNIEASLNNNSETFAQMFGAVKAQSMLAFGNNFKQRPHFLQLNSQRRVEELRLISVICHVATSIIFSVDKNEVEDSNVYSFLLKEGSFEERSEQITRSILPGIQDYGEIEALGVQEIQRRRTRRVRCTCGFEFFTPALARLNNTKRCFRCCNCGEAIHELQFNQKSTLR